MVAHDFSHSILNPKNPTIRLQPLLLYSAPYNPCYSYNPFTSTTSTTTTPTTSATSTTSIISTTSVTSTPPTAGQHS